MTIDGNWETIPLNTDDNINFRTDEVDCEIHGLTPNMMITIDEELKGIFCMKCYTEFLSNHIKNFVETDEGEEINDVRINY